MHSLVIGKSLEKWLCTREGRCVLAWYMRAYGELQASFEVPECPRQAVVVLELACSLAADRVGGYD